MATVVDTTATPTTGQADGATESKWYNTANDMLAGKLPELVKGAGFARPGGNKPLDDQSEILNRAFEANKAIRAAVTKSHTNPQSVAAGLNPAFTSQFGAFTAAMGAPGFGTNPMQQMADQVSTILSESLGKNVTLSSPLSSGFVPYDLVNPSRLIYPVYSPLRNKIPRVPGQGTSRRAKIITGVSGSNTSGGSGGGTGSFVDISSAETTNFGTWPNNLPNAGSQSATEINVPYRFFGMSESLSWLAQFSGQGFEDISALANLILLQEFMLNEEAAMIAGTTTAITAPTTAVTLAARTAGSTETALPSSSHFWVAVTAANYFGETVINTVSSDLGAVSATQVVDVTLPQSLPAGAMWWNIYVNNQSAGAPTQTTVYRMAANVGGNRFTLQGPTVPNAATTATPNPPASDSGTAGSNRIAGIIPTLTGQAATAGTYPSGVGWQAGYYNPKVGTHLTYNSVYNMLNGLWNGDPRYGTGFGAFKADPTELIGNSTDIMNLSNDVLQVGASTNYRLTVEQGDTSGVRIGAAVSEFQNPVTRSVLRLLVHPWWPQGTVVGMSYSLPFSWSNISNVWEMTMVQDYLSISWPVIDPTFRYSMFMYGGLVCNAPQYCGIMQGLQSSDTTPYA